jgi:hypothetical protein
MIVLCFSMQGEDFLSIVMASVMCLHFSVQGKDILEHTNAKCQFSQQPSVHFSLLVDHFVT